MVQWFTMKTTNNKINLLCNILDIIWHSTKLNINLKKKQQNIFLVVFFLSGRAYSEEQHSSINGFAEALLLQQMKIENTGGRQKKGERKRRINPKEQYLINGYAHKQKGLPFQYKYIQYMLRSTHSIHITSLTSSLPRMHWDCASAKWRLNSGLSASMFCLS